MMIGEAFGARDQWHATVAENFDFAVDADLDLAVRFDDLNAFGVFQERADDLRRAACPTSDPAHQTHRAFDGHFHARAELRAGRSGFARLPFYAVPPFQD